MKVEEEQDKVCGARFWVVSGKTSLDTVSMRQLPNGKFVVIPSYNQYSFGATKQVFDNEEDAINELRKNGKVKRR